MAEELAGDNPLYMSILTLPLKLLVLKKVVVSLKGKIQIKYPPQYLQWIRKDMVLSYPKRQSGRI